MAVVVVLESEVSLFYLGEDVIKETADSSSRSEPNTVSMLKPSRLSQLKLQTSILTSSLSRFNSSMESE